MMPDEFKSKSHRLYIKRLNHFLLTPSHSMCKFGHLTCISSIPCHSCHVQVWSLLAHHCFHISIIHPHLHFPYPFCAFTTSPPLSCIPCHTFRLPALERPPHPIHPSFLPPSHITKLQVNTALISLIKTNRAFLLCAVVAANQH